jgi:hypothetical protein
MSSIPSHAQWSTGSYWQPHVDAPLQLMPHSLDGLLQNASPLVDALLSPSMPHTMGKPCTGVGAGMIIDTQAFTWREALLQLAPSHTLIVLTVLNVNQM